MRKYLAVPLAGLIALAVAAPALAGPNVGNFSGSVDMAQGTWESYDEDKQSYQWLRRCQPRAGLVGGLRRVQRLQRGIRPVHGRGHAR